MYKRQEKVWAEIEDGKRYTGTVKSLTSYGAFVDIGGVDGMVHISEPVSYTHLANKLDKLKKSEIGPNLQSCLLYTSRCV